MAEMRRSRPEEDDEDERLFFIGIGLTDSVNFGSAHSLGELEEEDAEEKEERWSVGR